jgi:lysozyme family protein
MPSSFDNAFDFLIQHNIEGGLANLKDDSGELTKYGISSKSYPEIDIVNLTKDDAKEIYKKDWWPNEYNYINFQEVATKLFLSAINIGQQKAHEITQTAINNLGACLKIDGHFGPKTLRAINELSPDRFLDKYKILLIEHYLNLDDKRINRKQASYLRSWIRRTLI